MIAHADDIHLARLGGCAAPGSGDWLNALPSSALGLSLTHDQAVLSSRCPCFFCRRMCVCGTNADEHGSYALICKLIKSRFTRHQMGNDVIRESLKSACISSTSEPTGLLRNDGRHPDGVTMLPWSKGHSLAWDFTCAHRLAASHLSKGGQEGSSVATAKEAIKRQHYNDFPSCYILEPLAVETLGGIGDSSCAFPRTHGQRIQEQTGEKLSSAWLRQRLSIAVQRGNAACILESVPDSSNCSYPFADELQPLSFSFCILLYTFVFFILLLVNKLIT